MRKIEARRLLKVKEGASTEEVVDAWREAVRNAHPDRGGDGDVARLKKARDVLSTKTVGTGPANTCPTCAGRGHVRNKRGGKIRCNACNGTGYRRA